MPRRPHTQPYPPKHLGGKYELDELVIGFLTRARHRLDIAVFGLTHDGIAAAIVNAHERGVAVRVLLDNRQAAGRYSDDERLEEAGIEVRRWQKAGIMHLKVCLCDLGHRGRSMVSGSMNWTAGGTGLNAEVMQIVRHKRMEPLMLQYQAMFERLWTLNA